MPKTLTNRKLLAYGTCGPVHYAMTEEEKADRDTVLSPKSSCARPTRQKFVNASDANLR
jgi:hypothetical protein